MPRSPLRASPAVLALVLAACSPTYNWREIRLDPGALHALLPCKPDRATREVELDGQRVALTMAGCEADGATFTLAALTRPASAPPERALTAWKSATLRNLRGRAEREEGFSAPGLGGASGQRQQLSGFDGQDRPLMAQATYFSRGQQVYQALLIAPKIAPEVADTFFASLALR